MNCATCGAWSSVAETRKTDQGFTLMRRRRCANGHAFTTYEVVAPVYRHSLARVREKTRGAVKRAANLSRNAKIVVACKTQSQSAVAAQFGMTQSAVSKVVRNAS